MLPSRKTRDYLILEHVISKVQIGKSISRWDLYCNSDGEEIHSHTSPHTNHTKTDFEFLKKNRYYIMSILEKVSSNQAFGGVLTKYKFEVRTYPFK